MFLVLKNNCRKLVQQQTKHHYITNATTTRRTITSHILPFDNNKVNVEAYNSKNFKPKLVYNYTPSEINVEAEQTKELNLCNAVNDAMKVAMNADETTVVFGEDVAFGGVFRCSVDLRDQ